ncbi:MAG TPA: hypothetical protein VJY54_13560 [Lachnospiraceae bacterium]|nr:hypothetical protein [Lachnospiraceae bacterium]
MKIATGENELETEDNWLGHCRTYIGYLLRMVVYAYLIAIACMLPFYFVIETGYKEIGSNKSAFFRKWGLGAIMILAIVFLIYIVFAFLCWLRSNCRTKKKFVTLCNLFFDTLSITDIFAIIYLMALGLSYYYTNYPESAFLGAPGWYMGFIPQLVLVGSYFAVSRLVLQKEVKWITAALLVVSFAIFTLGVLNRYGINPLGMESCGPGFISTIGNINWYCGYWSVLFPIGAGAYLFYKKGWSVIKLTLGIYVAMGFATGVTQGSDSGILVIIALILLLGCLCGKEEYRVHNYLQILLLFCGTTILLYLIQKLWPDQNEYITDFNTMLTGTALPFITGLLVLGCYILLTRKAIATVLCGFFEKVWVIITGLTLLSLLTFAVLLCLNSLRPGSIGSLSENPLFIFNADWASSRGATWTAGVKTWLSNNILHKILGVGPDSMAGYIYNGPDAALLEEVKAVFGQNRLTNAHGEWITILANLGILGLIGFGGMMVSAIIRFIKGSNSNPLCAAFGISLFCYTIHNIFSFQQTMNVTQMFIILALGECLRRQKSRQQNVVRTEDFTVVSSESGH